MINNITEKKSYVATDDEKEVWVEKDSFQTNFIWVKYADEDTKREVKECRCTSQLSVDGDYLYYIKDNYFFRLHMKMLVVEFIDENIYDFRIFRDTAIVIKGEKQEDITETRAIFLKISLTDLKKEFITIAEVHKNDQERDNTSSSPLNLSCKLDQVWNYKFNEKYLIWIFITNFSPIIASTDAVEHLMVTVLATGKTKQIGEWRVKSGVSKNDFIYGHSPTYEGSVIKLDEDWIYIKRTWEGSDVENFKISYDGTKKEILKEFSITKRCTK